MAVRLSDWLLGAGMLPDETIRAAVARQAVYGGALDTALLELDAIREPTLWNALAAATGLPVPDPKLCERPAPFTPPDGAKMELDGAWSERCRAVPVGIAGGALEILCGEPVARAELEAAVKGMRVAFRLFVVPEVRLAAVRQAVFGVPMSPRLVRVFAKVVGGRPVRLWHAASETRTRTSTSTSTSPSPSPSPSPSSSSSSSSKADVPALIAKVKRGKAHDEAVTELVAITKQDFGHSKRKWEAWWKKHKDQDRVEWLFEGLSHSKGEIREAAEVELRGLTGEYFGYHFDLPKQEREKARARWQASWHESARARPR